MKKNRAQLLIILFLLTGFLTWNSCSPRAKQTWYKGNLHTHTTNSDGDTDPEDVIQWYKDNGYNFLSITDHNYITSIKDYKSYIGEDFILISGNEISCGFEKKPLHLLALGLYDEKVKPTGGDSVLSTLQNNVESIRGAGAVPVLAHPNFYWAFGADEMININDCVLFEVLNAHPSVNNEGNEEKPSTEEMWDQVLSSGKKIYGIGTDDTHKIATYPGKSWIMLKAEDLTERSILEALEMGEFYVSTGVILDHYEVTMTSIKIRIHPDGTEKYTTCFIGTGGQILKQSASMNPKYKFKGGSSYVRAKILNSEGKLALTQPVFIHSE